MAFNYPLGSAYIRLSFDQSALRGQLAGLRGMLSGVFRGGFGGLILAGLRDIFAGIRTAGAGLAAIFGGVVKGAAVAGVALARFAREAAGPIASFAGLASFGLSRFFAQVNRLGRAYFQSLSSLGRSFLKELAKAPLGQILGIGVKGAIQGFAMIGRAIAGALGPPLAFVGKAFRNVFGQFAAWGMRAAGATGSFFVRMAVTVGDAFAVTGRAILGAVAPMMARGAALAGAAWSKAAGLASAAWSKFSAFTGLGAAFARAWPGVVAASASAARGMGRAFSGLGNMLKAGVIVAFPGIAAAFGNLAAGMGRAWGAVAGGLSRGFGKFFGGVAQVVGGIAKVGLGVVGGIVKVGAGLGLAAGRVVANVGGAVARAAGNAAGTIGRALGGLLVPGGVAGLAGGAGVLGFSAVEAIKMESRLTKLWRVMGGARQEAVGLGRGLAEMTATLPGMDMNKVLDIADFGARLGVAGPELRLFTADMAKFSVVLDEGDIPVQEATTRIVRLLEVFDQGKDKAINLSSALVALDQSSTASARDILDVSARLSGVASTLGLSTQKTLALAAALREAGIPLETAGTAMSQLMGRMASRRDMDAFARMAGMGTARFRHLLETDVLGAIKAVEVGISKMDPIDAIQSLDALHLDGQRVRGTLLQLGRVMDRLDTLVKISEDDWTLLSAVQKGFNEQSKSTEGVLKRMWNNVRLLAESFGQSLLPAIRGIADGVSAFTHDLRDALDANRPALQRWGEAWGATFRRLGTLFRNWDDWKQLAFSFLREVGGRFMEAFGAIGRNIMALFKWVIDSLIAGFQIAANKIAEAFHGAFKWVAGVILETLSGVFDSIGMGGLAAKMRDTNRGVQGGAAPRIFPDAAMPARPAMESPIDAFLRNGPGVQLERMRRILPGLRIEMGAGAQGRENAARARNLERADMAQRDAKWMEGLDKEAIAKGLLARQRLREMPMGPRGSTLRRDQLEVRSEDRAEARRKARERVAAANADRRRRAAEAARLGRLPRAERLRARAEQAAMNAEWRGKGLFGMFGDNAARMANLGRREELRRQEGGDARALDQANRNLRDITAEGVRAFEQVRRRLGWGGG